jgi:protein-ribulosamine 3-kinase
MAQEYPLIAAQIGNALGAVLRPAPAARVQGGSINDCYRWEGGAGSVFVKLAPTDQQETFEAEAAGLMELERAQAVRVPRVLSVGSGAGHAWMALEWIQFGARSNTAEAALGKQLARLHRVNADTYGWQRDNTIGSTPQLNAPLSDWPSFFRDRRLRYQLELAAANGQGGRLQQRGAALADGLDAFFKTYQPAPSLLHGDLWGGNWATDAQDRPVIFDPAVYYGDREADLAMTRLFGGFGERFYSAYQDEWPLDPDWRIRVGLYNLYHVLNHLNLFGDGYLGQALGMMNHLLAHLGH